MPKDINTIPENSWQLPISKINSTKPGPISGSRAHKKLGEEAIAFLRSEGFNDDEIYTEYTIQTGHRPRVIDVVGIKPDRKIAIECGNCAPGQLKLIRPYFDQVIHFPYKTNPYRYYKRLP